MVINELLTFVNNKIDVMKEDGISQICTSAFTELEIKTAKDLLFDSIPSARRKKIRKGTGKTRRDIDDIVTLMKEGNPESFPIFVARDLHRLPPVYFDHVDTTRLLKDILKLQQDVHKINEQFATKEQLNMLALDLNALKLTSLVNVNDTNTTVGRVNFKRGAAFRDSYEYNSGPMGLVHDVSENIVTNEGRKSPDDTETMYRNIIHSQTAHENGNHHLNASISKNNINNSIEIDNNSNVSVVCSRPCDSLVMTHSASPSAERPPPRLPPSSPAAVRVPSPAPARVPAPAPNFTSAPERGHVAARAAASEIERKQRSLADIVREGEWKKPEHNDEWIVYQKRRLRNRFVGNRGSATDAEDCFKAADVKIPIYIYNVSKEVTVCQITRYIQRKTSLCVTMEKMNMKRPKDYDSYKIFVPKHKLSLFMSDEFWPDGIAYRRFVNFWYKGSAIEDNLEKNSRK